MRAAVLLGAFAVVCTAAAYAPHSLPGARSTKICAAAGAYWPTMTVAVRGKNAWIACKEQARIVRMNTQTGKTVKSVRLRAPVVAVTSGLGAIWALDSIATLYRVTDQGKIARRVSLPAAAAYNIWIGGGSVWVADDQGAKVLRVAPRTLEVVARPRVGDGPADMAFDGRTAWVINHRNRVLTRIDLTTNAPSHASVIPGDAPERMVWARGRLWITGRGTDLLEVDPSDGSIDRTIEIGASGIDIAFDADTLWVPTRSDAVDRSGFPTMDALKRVSTSTGAVSTFARPTGRLDVHGIAVGDGAVWIADNTGGRLYRVPAR
jgi:hypothetical protein